MCSRQVYSTHSRMENHLARCRPAIDICVVRITSGSARSKLMKVKKRNEKELLQQNKIHQSSPLPCTLHTHTRRRSKQLDVATVFLNTSRCVGDCQRVRRSRRTMNWSYDTNASTPFLTSSAQEDTPWIVEATEGNVSVRVFYAPPPPQHPKRPARRLVGRGRGC